MKIFSLIIFISTKQAVSPAFFADTTTYTIRNQNLWTLYPIIYKRGVGLIVRVNINNNETASSLYYTARVNRAPERRCAELIRPITIFMLMRPRRNLRASKLHNRMIHTVESLSHRTLSIIILPVLYEYVPQHNNNGRFEYDVIATRRDVAGGSIC